MAAAEFSKFADIISAIIFRILNIKSSAGISSPPLVVFIVMDHKEDLELKNLASELWCWRRFLRGPWMTRRLN